MIIKKFKIGSLCFTWVLRHRWEKVPSYEYAVSQMKKRPELGIWYEKNKLVGIIKKDVKNTFTNSNYVNEHTVGLHIIVCKTWLRIKNKPTFGEKTK